MTIDERRDLLLLIEQVSQRHPQWRLGQLIANLTTLANQNVWDVEDHELLEAARTHLEQTAPIETHPVG